MELFEARNAQCGCNLDFRPQIKRIVRKLKRARAGRKLCFGSNQHGFCLERPLSEQAVLSFESQYGITLPDDYRQFLTVAGSSGAGPYYGIPPLDRWDDATDAGKGNLPADFLARSCPLVPGIKSVRESQPGNESELDQEDALFQGAIALIHQGCTYYGMLIVSGAARGRIVYISLDDRESVYFPEDSNFLSWYERWLDELFAGYSTDWFGFGAIGTEQELARRLRDGTVSTENKQEAIRTLARISTLTVSTMEGLWACSRNTDADADLRAATASLFAARTSSANPVRVKELLEDSCPQVRKEVLLALVRIKSPMLAVALRQLVRDADPGVVSTVLFHGKHILTREEIQPWLRSSNLEVRCLAIYALGGASDYDVEELIALAIHDQDGKARLTAIQALRDRGDSAAPAPLIALLERETDPLLRTNIVRALDRIGWWPSTKKSATSSLPRV